MGRETQRKGRGGEGDIREGERWGGRLRRRGKREGNKHKEILRQRQSVKGKVRSPA